MAKITLQVLQEQQLYTPEIIWHQVKNQQNAAIRFLAAEALITHTEGISQAILTELFRESYAPVKQLALQYIIDHKRAVPPQLIVPLLTDKNELVRIRAARLLLADGISPTGYYLTVFNNPSCRIAERCTALLGLNEQKYQHVTLLTLDHLASSHPAMYKTSLQVVVRNLQEGSREYLMGALTNPSYSIARLACRQIVKLKLYLTRNDLQHCIAVSPSVPHSMIYFSLAQRLSLWDCLIFLLTNVAVDNGRFTQEGLIRCNARVNRYYETPSESQQVQLAGLLDEKGKTLLKHQEILAQRLGEYFDLV